MKKIILAFVAFMLVLGMTQCKKEQPNNATIDEGETVYISLKVSDDGAKHVVYPGTGAVVYRNGDVIYVGNNGKYVGSLTYANGTFSGSITNPSTDDYLHFYFTGGKTPSTTPTAGSTTSFTVSIADQTSQLPVLSYGHSTTKYVDGNTAYTCMLENKCGLVKFVPAIPTNETISVGGMRTTATIDFATSGITPTAATGAVSLYSVSNAEKWAILLPQDEVTLPAVTIDNFCSTTIESVPEVTANMYYNTGVGISMTALFTVNADGKQVYFAKGNLKYTKSTNTWSFMEHQYDMVETTGQNIGSFYANADVVSLFGWGTSGYKTHNTHQAYQPYNTSINYDVWYIVYGDAQYSLFDQTGKADWGYNAISNGGNTENSGWRTPTQAEWDYVFKTRDTPSGIRYAMAKVNDVNGIILLPDTWATDLYALNNTNFTYTESPSYNDNVISVDDWTNILEANGAVFLPAAGSRYNTSISFAGTKGYYWSATAYPYPPDSGYSPYYAYEFYFLESGYYDTGNISKRSNGCSVRLVKDVN